VLAAVEHLAAGRGGPRSDVLRPAYSTARRAARGRVAFRGRIALRVAVDQLRATVLAMWHELRA